MPRDDAAPCQGGSHSGNRGRRRRRVGLLGDNASDLLRIVPEVMGCKGTPAKLESEPMSTLLILSVVAAILCVVTAIIIDQFIS
jgi:hypothetical protein